MNELFRNHPGMQELLFAYCNEVVRLHNNIMKVLDGLQFSTAQTVVSFRQVRIALLEERAMLADLCASAALPKSMIPP